VTVTFISVKSYFEDGRLAVLSAFLTAAGPHLTISINYFIVGNRLGLILMMILYIAMAKSFADRSRAWLISTVAISWLMLGIHFALARKILCIIHHLLVTGEQYVEEGFAKKIRVRPRALEGLPLEEMARILTSAGYLVQAPV
jgi:hypothetical protein